MNIYGQTQVHESKLTNESSKTFCLALKKKTKKKPLVREIKFEKPDIMSWCDGVPNG